MWCYLYFPALVVDNHRHQQQNTQPLALLEPSTRSIIAQCCQQAYAQSVRPGQRAAQALALSPQLQLLPYQPNLPYLTQVAQTLSLWLPSVALDGGDSLYFQFHELVEYYLNIDELL